MKKFLGFFVLFLSCYTIRYIADVDIQYDPLTRIDKESSLIYVDLRALQEGLEQRKLEFQLKNSLKANFYKVIENEKNANVILKVNDKILQKKRIDFVTVPEETEIKKSTYNKKDNFFLIQEPKSKTTYTTYKKVPVEASYDVYQLQLSFIKLKDGKKIEAIKASMEVEENNFEKNIEIFISKFIEQINLQKEIRNTKVIWTQK